MQTIDFESNQMKPGNVIARLKTNCKVIKFFILLGLFLYIGATLNSGTIKNW